MNAFEVKDGDRIRVETILPYSQRAIYLEGHVVRPGRFSFNEGMRLSDVLHSYRDLLPEPASTERLYVWLLRICTQRRLSSTCLRC